MLCLGPIQGLLLLILFGPFLDLPDSSDIPSSPSHLAGLSTRCFIFILILRISVSQSEQGLRRKKTKLKNIKRVYKRLRLATTYFVANEAKVESCEVMLAVRYSGARFLFMKLSGFFVSLICNCDMRLHAATFQSGQTQPAQLDSFSVKRCSHHIPPSQFLFPQSVRSPDCQRPPQ
jgi:hypothetical protein